MFNYILFVFIFVFFFSISISISMFIFILFWFCYYFGIVPSTPLTNQLNSSNSLSVITTSFATLTAPA